MSFKSLMDKNGYDKDIQVRLYVGDRIGSKKGDTVSQKEDKAKDKFTTKLK